MYLKQVSISNFRSIDAIAIENCGTFNVLIGKNNSGKSNVLTAISAFFSFFQGKDVVTLEPTIGRSIDYFKNHAEKPIEITAHFTLTSTERDSILEGIVAEAPQMRNAVEGISPITQLKVSIAVLGTPDRFAFVKTISLLGFSQEQPRSAPTEYLLFKMGEEAALEIFRRKADAKQKLIDVEILGQVEHQYNPFSSGDWKEIRTRLPSRYILRDLGSRLGSPSSALQSRIASVAEGSETYEDFARSLHSMIDVLKSDVSIDQREPLRNKVSTFSGEEANVPSYIYALLANIGDIDVLYLKERRKEIGREEAEQLLALKVRRGGTDKMHSIQNTVLALLGVHIDAFSSDKVPQRDGVNAEVDVDNFLVEVNGAGVREALRLVLDVKLKRPQILLVEEPEIHLHPALEVSMMRFLKSISDECQTFITTHSTNFLDTAEMKNAYLISKLDSTRIQHLSLDEASTEIPEELGIRLSSLFMYDRLIFVEGSSDEAILREWAEKLGINLSQVNVGFVHMGGARNFAHFAVDATLSFLTRRRIKLWFLLDKDEKSDEDIKQLQARLGDSAHVIALAQREIENYLIMPRPLAEFIALKLSLSGNSSIIPPTVEELDKLIDNTADHQKNIAIFKRVARQLCRPIYPPTKREESLQTMVSVEAAIRDDLNIMIQQLEAMRAKVQDAQDEQAELLNREWPTKKRSIVLGDLLLDEVCRKFDVRFKKDRDGARLAFLMNESEIPEEIKSFLNEVGKP